MAKISIRITDDSNQSQSINLNVPQLGFPMIAKLLTEIVLLIERIVTPPLVEVPVLLEDVFPTSVEKEPIKEEPMNLTSAGLLMENVPFGSTIRHRCHHCNTPYTVVHSPYQNEIKCPHCDGIKQFHQKEFVYYLSEPDQSPLMLSLPAERHFIGLKEQEFSLQEIDHKQTVLYYKKKGQRRYNEITIELLLHMVPYSKLKDQRFKWIQKVGNRKEHSLFMYNLNL